MQVIYGGMTIRLNNASEFENVGCTPLKMRCYGGFHVISLTAIDGNGSILVKCYIGTGISDKNGPELRQRVTL